MKNRIIHYKDNTTELVDEETLCELVDTKKADVEISTFINGLTAYKYVMKKGRKV